MLVGMAGRLHSPEVRAEAAALLRSGLPNAEVARRFGVSANTVGVWKHRDMRRLDGPQRQLQRQRLRPRCPRCHPADAVLDTQSYSYLLGLYLGDGTLRSARAMRDKGVYTLAVACADAWPGLIDACEAAIRAVMPGNKVSRVQRPGMHEVVSYSQHWPCLFPQHGPGRKHERVIALEDWQQAIVDGSPREFVRGLLHSDGCRVTNWTEKTVAGVVKRYEYPRYHLKNESTHIRALFTDTLDKLGIDWRRSNRNCISVSRRAAVAAMDEFVGPKY